MAISFWKTSPVRNNTISSLHTASDHNSGPRHGPDYDEMESTPLPPYGFESRFQRRTGCAAFAILLVNNKTGYPPEFLVLIRRREISIVATMVNPWKFLSGTILAPSHWLPICVDNYPVSSSIPDERFLLPTVSHRSLSPRARSGVLGLRVRFHMMVHAPTPPRIPNFRFLEKPR